MRGGAPQPNAAVCKEWRRTIPETVRIPRTTALAQPLQLPFRTRNATDNGPSMYTSNAMLLDTRAPRDGVELTSNRNPIIVLPGFMACDLSTTLLRAFLRHLGYDAMPWGFGRNVGPVDGLMQHLVEHVHATADDANEPVILVGHSLGGIYAREIAKSAPQSVRAVFTLGSPFRALSAGHIAANLSMLRLIERATGRSVEELRARGLFEDLASPPPVRCISVYSKRDGTAPWQSCLETPTHLAENVEVQTTHRRMVVSPTVFRAISDRLAFAGCAVEDDVQATATSLVA
jgi:pimeloyl-ACP methyl ester carboxylesterase